jgi:filamentous hemagglutinin
MSAPGSLINTALLYAANNLALYANSITNQRGNILAGNSLWMQRDAAGNANAEVINTSGTIETRNGDIAINTGHLLNQRDGFTTTASEQTFPEQNGASVIVNIEDISRDKLQYNVYQECGGAANEHCYDYVSFHLKASYDDIKQIVSQEEVTASAQGNAARIASGRNLSVSASQMDNFSQ